ncbi:glycoside hydrolase family 16 protein [Daldinia caldariorum]|uniref:glycoside hydrolase family 16 protein n=1 Tax=Daldinia caldariorum TaxID=326644 RepID=UPI002008E6AF|nr:glycoside hydrolase family 16 protein [Daldinia caldariorum]KAI1466022.1 glycoside hydrolase family 16 protein [Daldinia caldariorum]
MAPSLFKTVGTAAAILAARAGATESYQVTEVYNSTNFLDKFDFFTGTDPTGGYVQYQNQASAQDLGLIKVQDDEIYLGVDQADGYQPNGGGRKSVRLESKKIYDKGLVIAEFSHLPKPVCGSWPAFWFFGDPWPTKGEIDLYENWNDLKFNRHTSHVDKPDVVGDCVLVADDMTAKIDSPNCYDFAEGQANFQGCSASEFSSTFGSADGGIFAMEWTDDFLKIWDWPRNEVPEDISSGQPSPSDKWGKPSYVISNCNVDKAFKEMKMVLNINFCGVAGQTGQWDTGCAASTGFGTCPEYVAAKGGDFESTNFKVKDIKIYELKEGEAPKPSTSSTVPSTSAAPSSSSAAPTVSTTSEAPASSSESPKTTSSASESKPTSSVPEDDDSCTDKNGETSTASVSATPTTKEPEMTTSTIYSTDIHTITSCADTVTNCPAKGYVTTKIISVGTTVCPVTKSEAAKTESTPAPTSTSSAPYTHTTSVIEITNVYTITSCAPTVTNCPVGAVTSEVTVTTTVCPVSEGSSSASSTLSAPSAPAESTSSEEKKKSKTKTSATETVATDTQTPASTPTPEPTTSSSSKVPSSETETPTGNGGYPVVTPSTPPSSTINLGYNGTITTSYTAPGSAASTGFAGCTGPNCVIPVAGGVKTSASFTLMGMAAFFFLVI